MFKLCNEFRRAAGQISARAISQYAEKFVGDAISEPSRPIHYPFQSDESRRWLENRIVTKPTMC